VLADVEGGGFYRIDPWSDVLSVTVDDTSENRFEGSYDQSLLVTSPEPGSFRVSVCTRRPDSLGGSFEVGEKFEGCGWALGIGDFGSGIVDSALAIEDRPEPFDPDSAIPGPQWPVPFFRGVSGPGLRVIRAAERCVTVDAFDLSDAPGLRERGWTVQNGSKLFDLDSMFPDGTKRQAQVMSYLNRATWRVPVPPHCKGLIVRKLYDAFHGRQRARVLVDGAFVGWWYEPWQDRERRWRWARTGIDERFLKGKSEITLSIDPPAGSPLWSVSRIEVDALI